MADIEDDKRSRHYKWPWYVLAAVVLFAVLAVLWIGAAVHKIKQEREFTVPNTATN